MDRVTDSECFYNAVIEFLEDREEQTEVFELIGWWDRQIFPYSLTASRSVNKDSVQARIKERRRRLQEEAAQQLLDDGIQLEPESED